MFNNTVILPFSILMLSISNVSSSPVGALLQSITGRLSLSVNAFDKSLAETVSTAYTVLISPPFSSATSLVLSPMLYKLFTVVFFIEPIS